MKRRLLPTISGPVAKKPEPVANQPERPTYLVTGVLGEVGGGVHPVADVKAADVLIAGTYGEDAR
jgi:hypothetical protein